MNIEVNNIKIHYEILGEGKPIIILNPNSVNTNSMNFIAHKLSKDFKVYKFDRRCCGRSERKCELTYEQSAKDVYEFIEKLNIDKPFLLGSSGGASVALNIAINYPNCISKLIICSGVARMNAIQKPTYAKVLNKLLWYPGKKNNLKFEKLNTESKSLTRKRVDKNRSTYFSSKWREKGYSTKRRSRIYCKFNKKFRITFIGERRSF